MPLGVLFWMLMIIWVIFGTWSSWPNYPLIGGSLLLFILLAILGYHDFGAVVR